MVFTNCCWKMLSLSDLVTAKPPQSHSCPKLPTAYQFSHRAARVLKRAAPVLNRSDFIYHHILHQFLRSCLPGSWAFTLCTYLTGRLAWSRSTVGWMCPLTPYKWLHSRTSPYFEGRAGQLSPISGAWHTSGNNACIALWGLCLHTGGIT